MQKINEINLYLKYENIFQNKSIKDLYNLYKNNIDIFSIKLDLLNYYQVGTLTKYNGLFCCAGFIKSLNNKYEEIYLILIPDYTDKNCVTIRGITKNDVLCCTKILTIENISDLKLKLYKDNIEQLEKLVNSTKHFLKITNIFNKQTYN